MKKAFFALAIPALLVACNSVADGEFVLKGSVSGADGKNIILKRQDSLGITNLDTAKIANGKFEFHGKIDEPEMYALHIDSTNSISRFIAETGEIEIEIVKDSVFKNKVSGTYNNEKLADYIEMTVGLKKEMDKEWQKLQPMFILAQNKKDTATIRKVQAKMEGMQQEAVKKTDKWIKDNPKAFISILLIQDKFRMAFEPDMETIESLYQNLDPELKKLPAAKKLKNTISEFKVVKVGRRAPDFSAQTPEGKQVSLKDAKGKVTIIDFWASWCGPCRKANPELVAIYNEFHPKGLNIIGVSLDKPGQKDAWVQAIQKDGLVWTQVSNLKEWNDPIAQRYSVEEIPTSFVVNQYGIVIGKNLHGDELRAKINEWLAKPDAPK